MDVGIVIPFFVIGIGFGLFSSVTFFIVLKPEISFSDLMMKSTWYWNAHLDEVVPLRWVKPIYWSALLGATLFAIGAVGLLLL